ncbi:PilL N-terminal domain-containing protein [Stutzerimonas stutzeri]|uniref:PFGI-1 class ICE element type IV pilus protein PilL2 n=1 Tax=Stutzerimonas stutzeri TaxID=316 RepID=UPI0037149B4E
MRYGRYTLVSTSPRAEQRDLLSQIIDVTVPQSMNPSVHDAMSYVLQRSGYRLCPATGEIEVLYGLPLPASQYQLGPMTLRNTVQVLAGPAWQVIVDEVSRNICFEKRPGYERIATPSPLVNASAAQVDGGAR